MLSVKKKKNAWHKTNKVNQNNNKNNNKKPQTKGYPNSLSKGKRDSDVF